MRSSPAQNWWQEFFTPAYGDAYLDRADDPHLSAKVQFLIEKLDLKPGSLLFDQCCGTGVISHEFAKHGIRAIGVDQSAEYIARASHKSGPCRFFADDAFTFTTPEPCDAAINWMTSFGFLPDDRQNIRMMTCVYESLKQGGKFCLEYANGAFDIAQGDQKNEHMDNGTRISRTTRIDHDCGMKCSEWIYTHHDGATTRHYGETRLYMPQDIENMMHECGFTDIECLADTTGAPLTPHSRRMMHFGVKA